MTAYQSRIDALLQQLDRLLPSLDHMESARAVLEARGRDLRASQAEQAALISEWSRGSAAGD